MARTLKTDKLLFWIAVALVSASLAMILSASGANAEIRHGDRYHFFLRQLPWVFLGVVALFALMRTDYHELRRPEVIWPLVGITIVALCLVYVSPQTKGAQRWIKYGPISAQPSELAKIAAIIFAAAVLERRMHRIHDVRFALGPIAIVVGAFLLLIVPQPDLGTPIMLAGAIAVMVIVAGLSWRYVAGAGLVALPALALLVLIQPYRWERIMDFFSGNTGHQATQSIIAIGSGGLTGLGFFNGKQKLFFLPEPHNDFIFAVVGEEWGLLGTTALVFAFGLIVWRGLRAALLAPDRFGTLLAVGLVMMIGLQAFFNMSVAAGIAPTKGIPLPLFSAGGSSLFVNLMAIGILLNISQQGSATHLARERTVPQVAHVAG